ncbi:MAG: sugar ABC transporter permease [Bacteroidetes bacterium]|nr:sugar ABC transporter permease [Bacteroidota bacterium]
MSQKQRVGVTTYLFFIPAILCVLAILLYPVGKTIYLSFTDSEGLLPPVFIGFDNYQNFINDPVLRATLTNVLIWTIATLVLPVFIGLLIANVVSGVKGSAVYRMIFLLPYVLSGVAVGALWFNIFETEGLLNSFLVSVGLESWVNSWLLYYPQNTLSMIIAATWASTGLVVVLFTVGIQNVPLQTVEAATLDGANSWVLFWKIIWPQLKYIRAVVIGTALANSLRTFDIVWVMTGGGPSRTSETLAVTMYREAFLLNRYGYGSAIAVFLMILVTTISILALRGGLKKEATL